MKSCFLSLLVVMSVTMPVSAQKPAPVEPPKPQQGTAAKPPGDPFVKAKPEARAGGGAGVASTKKPVEVMPPSYHLVFTFETYNLPQSALDALHAERLASKPFFDRVRQLVAAGEASLETVTAVPTRPGQRATFESVDELIYPIEFGAAVPGRAFHFPTAYETRPLGERIEVDPVEGPDGNLADLNMSQEFVRLVGFSPVRADPAAEGELQPTFASRKVNTAITCPIDVPTLVGTTSAPRNTGIPGADGDGSVSVTFARYRRSAPLAAAAGGGDVDETPKNMRLVFRFYSLPREKARDMLADTVDAEKLHSQVVALPAEEVKLERLITMITRSGQRSYTEETGEWIHGIEVEPSKPVEPTDPNTKPAPSEPALKAGAQLLPAGFSAFEMRTTGWRIEVDPVLGPDWQTVDLNLAPQLTEYRGVVRGHPLLARYPEMPLFATQKISTAVYATVNRQCFLGTMSRPRETGANDREDDGRTWLGFVKATME